MRLKEPIDKQSKPDADESTNCGYIASSDGKDQTQHDQCYHSKEEQTGLVAIINNFTTGWGSNHRAGTIEDEERIVSLFESPPFKNHYTVSRPRRDLNMEQFTEALDQWSEELERNDSNYNSFILFILSHGKKNSVRPYHEPHERETYISVDDIIQRFHNCLHDRPKVIFIQACQQGVKDSVDVEDDSTPSNQSMLQLRADYMSCKPPTGADMLISMSCFRGFRSFRSSPSPSTKKRGSWFIRNLIEQLEEAHKSTLSSHLLDILTEVNLQVSLLQGRYYSPDAEDVCQMYVRQMPCFQSSLRRKFYLLPPKRPSSNILSTYHDYFGDLLRWAYTSLFKGQWLGSTWPFC